MLNRPMTPASVVHRPAVKFPEHRVTLTQMQHVAHAHYAESPNYARIRRMIENTEIEERRFILPAADLGRPMGLAERTDVHLSHLLPLARDVSLGALSNAKLRADEVDLIIASSCTSFVMPSVDAYLINELGLRPDVKRMPIAQLGCAAGASALLKANDYCKAYPNARVLVVCAELSSLCFFPEFKDLTSAVCASIFGDGAAACVVSGAAAGVARGLHLVDGLSVTLPNSEHYIRYQVTDSGYHLTLDKQVMYSVKRVAPYLEKMLTQHGARGAHLDFLIAHTGGKRILNALVEALAVSEHLVKNSRDSLREAGNTASVSILDVLGRAYENEARELVGRSNLGMLVAFGPGFTMDAITARWQ